MKSGRRALGVAESFTDSDEKSTLAGAVVQANRAVDGFEFGDCTIGGMDSAEAIIGLYESLDREDIRYIFINGIAPAWYNIIDMDQIAEEVDRPVIALSYEESEGLEQPLRKAFSGREFRQRYRRYQGLPERKQTVTDGHVIFYRSAGLSQDETAAVIQAYTGENRRPEPVRVAKLAASAIRRFRR